MVVDPTVSIRQATVADCPLMFRLQRLDGAELDERSPDQAAAFKTYEAEFEPNKIQVIETKGVPVGRLRVVRDNGIYIGGLQILPSYRRQGIGTAVLKSLIQESKQANEIISLEVVIKNTRAVRLYKKLGFEVISETSEKQSMKYDPVSSK